ncbi:MAG: peptide chain release factor 1 [Peptococcaceae bacterium]|nr:peptide chain release factor 1 [Peptococcaceae bacterium]
MFDKLADIENRYDELTRLLSDPQVISAPEEFRKHAKAQAAISDVVEAFRAFKYIEGQLNDLREMLGDEADADMREMIVGEQGKLNGELADLRERLKVLLLPKDPHDEKNVIVEVRGGTGGEEAALFAGDLFRMYTRYAEMKRWRVEVLNANYTDIGGVKEVVFLIEGSGAYSRLKFESGVHRVQRIPATESGGRIHTSAATVAVLPEAEEVDVEINPNDVRVDIFCSSGPGGQSVNTTQSAVRVTHVPTGMVVSCQDEKSQHKNKDKAMKVLRARLLEKMQMDAHGEMAETRRSQVGSGDRSERIRTYNFPQGRVSDHRIGLTLHKIEAIMLGDLDEVIDALITTHQAELLQSASVE